jgi:anti-anti-sigma factor
VNADDEAGDAGPFEVGVLVALHGDLTFETADRWHEVTRHALDSQPSKVTVDLADVSFLDSSGMYILVRLQRHAQELGVTMDVVNVPDNVLLALRTADLVDYLGIEQRRTERRD